MIFQINPLAWKPQLVLGAVLAAGVPIGAVAWKSYRTSKSNATIEQASADQSRALGTGGNAKLKANIDATLSSSGMSNAASTPALPLNSFGGMQAWFEGSANPFLTTAQAKDRKLNNSLAKVEAALRRRSDVEEVLILVDENAQKNVANGFVVRREVNAEKTLGEINASSHKPKAVVSIRMRNGSLPVSLADTAGSLVSAALENVNAEDVEVLDERSGARVRARTLDANASIEAREDLALAVACEQQEVQQELLQILATNKSNQSRTLESGVEIEHQQPVGLKENLPYVALDNGGSQQMAWAQAWWWCALVAVFGLAIGICLWWKRSSRPAFQMNANLVNTSNALVENVNTHQGVATLSTFQFWSAPLACALHKCVAEKPALIAATLVQRLDGAPSSRQDVATMMLELEPWAADRILAVLPSRSLDVLENAIKQAAAPVNAQQVRALAETIVSLRNAA